MTNGSPLVPTWQKVAFAVIGIAALVLLVYIANLSRSGFATVNGQKATAARQDCARAISDQHADVKDRRDNLVARGLLAIEEHDEPALPAIRQQLEAAIAAVDALEPLQREVDQRCPKVG